MNIDKPLYWHQGLFLQPQHFQQNDARLESLVTRTLACQQPHAWGLISMCLNDAALASRQCRIEQLSVRFTDGSLVEYPGNALLECRPLALADFVSDSRTLYVGLKRSQPGEPDAQVFEALQDAEKANVRFAVRADPQTLDDRHGDAPEALVRQMSYVLRLFWEEELDNLGAYELLPIARLEHDGDRIHLADRYIPPCVMIGASPALMQTLRDTRDELVGRARQLEVFKQSGDARYGDFDAAHTHNLLALVILNRYGPLLTHLLETPHVSPWQVYGTLRQLIGELSVFSERCDMLGQTHEGRSLLTSYQHETCGQAITLAAGLIGQLLNEISVGSELLVRLLPSDGLFQSCLPDAFLGPRHRYYLVVRSDGDPTRLAQQLELDAKLGAPQDMPDLINRALPGVELIYLQVPPQGMPRRPGALYYRLEPLSEAWETVCSTQAAALFMPNAPADMLVELVVVRA
ncbi:MAG: type VI secretion system baseplate subunit TssK [Pseudomonas fluorescens]|jgi:type VI secretion system protein ImpJ|uniref:type VI secretion system baseplate subunit TssK n=1 Tax=Pseudomonas TaxID=286 RepID=UPI00084A495F|nr:MULTISPECIES: type VI secretion system baseplate subunit TssK [Pseudomonas]MBK5543467.1 type VI secretion system baseplate subunit TssK [Pseudomonas sp. TH04]NNB68346.1 type VI secretion system baseplate subunit TssK [Pseudomonas fluorescens]OEC72501.1 type VI secretion system-associated protein [Pseudomonas sp. AP19]OPB02068.1 type VI secretion system-associated protein [Pseudomonas fluorescens]